MNREYDVRINQKNPDYMIFSLWSSPNSNNINFIKNNLNKSTKREYTTAEIKLKEDNYTKHIFDYYKDYKIAYLSYINIIKEIYNKTQKNAILKTYTTLKRKNTIKTNKRNKYYNKQSSINTNKYYTISKGYGKILLQYIEEYLKEKGVKYIILIPSKSSLIKYYEILGYKIKYIPNNSVSKENNNEALEYNKEAVSQFMIMYKNL
jgi:hypothetical protein